MVIHYHNTVIRNLWSLRWILLGAFVLPLMLAACGGGSGDDTNFNVSATAGAGGSIDPSSATVASGDTASFTVTPDSGYAIDTVTGCGGSLSGSTYTTDAITADCTVSASFALLPPASAAVPTLSFTQVKLFRFSWTDVAGATFYRLLENPDGVSGFSQVGSDIPAGTQLYGHEVPLYARVNARYMLQSCNAAGCTDSSEVSVSGNLAEAVGYFKASNTGAGDEFGYAVALSGDGNTLAVGAPYEDKSSTKNDTGAVYVFTRTSDNTWIQQSFFTAPDFSIPIARSNDNFGYSVALSADGDTLAVGTPKHDPLFGPPAGSVFVYTRDAAGSWSLPQGIETPDLSDGDQFGASVALSADGKTLAVGAPYEDSSTTGIDFTPNDGRTDSGAAYVFARASDDTWSQQASIKASYTYTDGNFGYSLALSSDGNTLVVGAPRNGIYRGGKVFVFGRALTFDTIGGVPTATITWSQQDVVGPSTTATMAGDRFGEAVALSADGNTLAVGARFLDPASLPPNSGAVYVYTRGNPDWSEQALITVSYADDNDQFGTSMALSADGNTLAVGAAREDSDADGIGGSTLSNGATDAGAVYVITRDDAGNWSQQAYVKASNSDAYDYFGSSVSLSDDGNTLAVGARLEDSVDIGIGGVQTNNDANNSGAVYVY